MKVQCLNSSSIKTRNIIKTTFAELLNEKKQIDKITVTELVKRANLTRSTFYTHYNNIYEVAQDYKFQTLDLLFNDNIKLYSKADIETYLQNIFKYLKDNEKTYKLLLSANESLLFLEKLKEIANEKIYDVLKYDCTNKYLQLDISFFMNGIMLELLEYFRNESNYSLDELLENIIKWFKKIFN